MTSLLRTPATIVWGVLVLATAVSWALGVEHGLADSTQQLASVTILVIAFVKIRFIGLYFMELRDAPLPLRAAFEGYCVVVCALVLGMFLVG